MPVGTDVTEDNLADYVAGLVVTNDVSARDVQLPKTQFYEAKSYPTFTPVGPALVLLDADELKRFSDLRLRLSVNGEVRQDACVGRRHDLPAGAGAAGAGPLPAPRPGRPPADRHPGRHRAERAAEAGRDPRLAAAARAASGRSSSAARRSNPQATCRTATSSRPPIATDDGAHRPRRASAPSCGGPDERRADHRADHRAAVARLRHARPTWPRSRPCRCRPAACPRSTYALLHGAATRWPDRTAVTVLPDAARWREPLRRTFAAAARRRPPVREPAARAWACGAATRSP